MERRRTLLGGTISLALLLVLFASPSHPMTFMVGGPSGTAEEPNLDCEDAPADGDSDGDDGGNNGNGGDDEECSSMEDWNPTIHCPVSAGDDVQDLLDCLLDEILNPPPACTPITTTQSGDSLGDEDGSPEDIMQDPPGQECVDDPMDREDFTVTLLPPPHFGLEILKLDGSEIERFSFRENFPGLQTVEVQLNLPDRVARIGEIVEQPSGAGYILLTVNRRIVKVDSEPDISSVELTGEVMRLLRRQGFSVRYYDPYMFIMKDLWFNTGIWQVQFRSTDSVIKKSDVSLLPPDAPELAVLSGPDPPER